MSKKELIPAIRFAGFTDAWEQRKVNDILKSINVNICQYYDDLGKYEVIQQGSEPIAGYTNEIPFTNCDSIVLFGDHTLSLYKPKMPFLVASDGVKAYCANNVSGYYLLYLLENNLPQNEGYKRYSSILKDKEILLTYNYNEQSKISNCLARIDDLITLHQRKYDKLVAMKKSLLEKMFPNDNSVFPDIRFKGYTEAWEQCKLGDLGISTSGTSIESEFSENGIYNVISIGSYSEDSVYNDQGIRAIHSNKTENHLLDKGDLTMILNDKTLAGRIIGRVLLIEKSDKYVYNQRTQRIQPNNDLFNSEFLYHLLNAPLMRNKIIKKSQGNTQIYVNWSTIKETEYFVPDLAEQVKLSKMFSQLNNLITLHQRKCEKLKNLKKSLLEKMFC